ncbi:MAG TPA: FAD-dependent monooxygenase, partial [Chloroflexota bacterium]|nr:FAD-dependent monooxygenase [Chloroflexota bacterium]
MAGLEYDVVVLGARIAGSTLATLLGQAGLRVLLVDRARFPSPTLSTHYFRGGRGVTALKHLDVLDSVLALGCPPLSCQYEYQDGGSDGVIQPAQQPGEVPYCLSVRRVSLDHLLVKRAAAVPSVDMREGTRATDLLWDAGRVVGVRLVTPTGEQVVRARCVVGADGRR